MDVTLVLFIATVSIFISNINADVPSCERARCHHCQMNFIAVMCPETCRSCWGKTAAPYHHFPMSPQQSQPETQLSSVRQFPTTSSPPVSNQQTLVNTVFPTFPPLLTFTFPTLPPFTFPTVTFAPPIYHSALPQIPSNQFPIQIPLPQKFDPIPPFQTQLFQPPRQIGVLGSEQTVAAPHATIGSQPQTYLQPLPPQTHPTSYAVQQQAVPVYPASKQQSAAYLPTQQLQPQRQVSYLQVQQQQQRPQPQPQP
ncbi:unnamed protein product, partial [Onchocerca flexuosa]|uniref:ShKT domain-containing protein n=1 Tax=Onchocerca flexuosa TaxID=387005 RepID=A0A183H6N7_9BILA